MGNFNYNKLTVLVKQIPQKINKLLRKRRAQYALIVLVAVVVLGNIALAIAYHERAYPNTTIGRAEASNRTVTTESIKSLQILPSKLTVSHEAKKTNVSARELGVSADSSAVVKQVSDQRSSVPMFNLFQSHKIAPVITVNQQQYDRAFKKLAKSYDQTAVNAQISLNNGVFAEKPQAEGFKLESNPVKQAIINSLKQGKTTTQLPITKVKPVVDQAEVKKTVAALTAQTKTDIAYTFEGRSKKMSAQEIGNWYESSGNSYVPSVAKISATITQIGAGFGIGVQNVDQVSAATAQALIDTKAYSGVLVAKPKPRVTYKYCTSVRGVDESNLGTLNAKLASVYGDARGWGLGGQVTFERVSSGCSLQVVLTAANLMPGFGAICDSTYSCTVKPIVALNYDRWIGASDSWNAAAGNLEDYRTMVINHETGHWFGYNHKHCSGAGQPAPVMQQQSITLESCAPNPWPLPGEAADLKRLLKL